MVEFGALIYFKKTKARVDHKCSSCGKTIKRNNFYYVETMQDNPLYRLRAKKLCLVCHRNLEHN